MSERDKKLLVYLGALLILAGSYFLVGRPYLDKIDELSNRKTELNAILAERQQAAAKQEDYKSQIREMNDEVETILGKFPEDIVDEKSIMFAYNAELAVPMNFSQLSFAEETESMIEGETTGDEQLEADVEEVASQGTSDANIVWPDGIPNTSLTGMNGKKAELGMTYSTSYQGFKDFLAYVRDYEDRLVITNIDAAYDQGTGLVSGSLILAQFAVVGPERELPLTETGKENALGTSNVFKRDGSVDSILDLIGLINAMGGNEGESIAVAADYTIAVDAVSDNTNAITVGRTNNDIEGKTFLTSSTNGTEDVYFTVTGSEGTYNANYSLAGKTYNDESFAKDSEEKIGIRIQSSYRVGDDDKVNAAVHITNETDKELVVMVTGDDPNQPRIDIVEKNGNITTQ